MGLLRWSAFGLSLLLLCSCEFNRDALPGLPNLATGEYLAPVRQQILSAQERVRRNPNDPDANGRLGMVLAAYGLSKSASICFERAHLLDPTVFRWSFYLAIVYSDLGRSEQAIHLIKRALAIRPEHLGSQLKLAGWLLARGDLAESRGLYEHVIARHRREVYGHFGLGQVLLTEGKLTEALASLRVALSLNDRIGAIHYALANAYQRFGEEGKARFHLRMFERYKDSPLRYVDPLIIEVSDLNVGDAPHITRADYAISQGRLDDAITSLKKAVAINPKNVTVRVSLMDLYARLGRMDKSREHYDIARDLDPTDPRPCVTWGEIQKRLFNYEQAAGSLAQASGLDPENALTHAQLGWVLEQLGDQNAAAGQYRQALKLNSQLSEAHFGLGQVLLARGEYEEATDHLEQAMQSTTGEVSLMLYRLAAAYEGLEQRELAVATLHRARRTVAETADIHLAMKIRLDLERLEASEEGEN